MYNFPEMHERIARTAQKTVFFVLGVPKSGTTWVQKLLDAHPDISCSGESHVLNVLTPQLCKLLTEHNKVIVRKNVMLYGTETGYPHFSNDHATYLAQAAFCLLLEAQAPGRTCQFLGEKTPDHMRHLPAITTMFPQAKFIHIIRDGRDCAVSGWYHVHRDTPEWAKQRFPKFQDYVDVFARGWANQIPPVRAFAQQRPDLCLEIRYEDLKQDTATGLTRMLRFLGASDDSAIAARCVEAASFKNLAKGRPEGQEDKGSFYRKGVTGDWKSHFDADCLAVFDRHAGDLLRQLGYA